MRKYESKMNCVLAHTQKHTSISGTGTTGEVRANIYIIYIIIIYVYTSHCVAQWPTLYFIAYIYFFLSIYIYNHINGNNIKCVLYIYGMADARMQKWWPFQPKFDGHTHTHIYVLYSLFIYMLYVYNPIFWRRKNYAINIFSLLLFCSFFRCFHLIYI